MSHDALTLSPGTLVDAYEIKSVLGTGGFGITYGAYDRRLERPVAIKEYFPSGLAYRSDDGTTLQLRSNGDGGAYEYGLRRFLAEARTLAKFQEPSIVRVTQYIEANGTAYFVMDYEDGKSLADYLDDVQTIDERETREIVVPILEGLQVVHAKAYLHRDIKPANIFLREDGPAVLLDFGAARQALEEQTSAMTVLLTPGYAPFEQYTKAEKQGPWSDLYALGATMFHCLTGMPPTPATERLSALYEDEPDPVDKSLKAMHKRNSAVFVKSLEWMLRPLAKDRPQTADAVLNVLAAPKRVQRPAVTLRGEDATSAMRPIDALVRKQAEAQSRPAVDTEQVDEPDTLMMQDEKREEFVCNERYLKVVEEILADFVGGLARRVVGPAVDKSASHEELMDFLSGFILSEHDQSRFRRKMRQLIREEREHKDHPTGPPLKAKLQSKSASRKQNALGPKVLKDAEVKLAEYLGPISKVLVKRAAQKTDNRRDFYKLLAKELHDSAERKEFLRGLK